MARYALARLAAQSEQPKPVTEVNIIPVIDISLVLLVILFVTAPLLSYPTLPVPLPWASQRPDQEVTLAVTYAQDGRLWVRASDSSWAALVPDLRRELSRRPGQTVLVRADRDAPYRVIQRLIRAAKEAGAGPVALAVEPPK